MDQQLAAAVAAADEQAACSIAAAEAAGSTLAGASALKVERWGTTCQCVPPVHI